MTCTRCGTVTETTTCACPICGAALAPSGSLRTAGSPRGANLPAASLLPPGPSTKPAAQPRPGATAAAVSTPRASIPTARVAASPKRDWGTTLHNGGRIVAKTISSLLALAVGAAGAAAGQWTVVAVVAAYLLYLWALGGNWIIY